MKEQIDKSLLIQIELTALILLFLLFLSSVSNAATIEGQYIIEENNDAKIVAWGHTSNNVVTHIQYVNVTNKKPGLQTGNLSFYYDTKKIFNPSFWLWDKWVHPKEIVREETYECTINGTLTNCTKHWVDIQDRNYEDWRDITSEANIEDYKNKRDYYFNDYTWTTNSTKQFKILYNTRPAMYGKFDVVFYTESPGKMHQGIANEIMRLDPWFNDSWTKCSNITFTNPFLENHTQNISLSANLASPTWFNYSSALSNLNDLRFLEGDCNNPNTTRGVLPHEVMYINTSGESLIHFRTYSNSTFLSKASLYFNNSDAINISNRTTPYPLMNGADGDFWNNNTWNFYDETVARTRTDNGQLRWFDYSWDADNRVWKYLGLEANQTESFKVEAMIKADYTGNPSSLSECWLIFERGSSNNCVPTLQSSNNYTVIYRSFDSGEVIYASNGSQSGAGNASISLNVRPFQYYTLIKNRTNHIYLSIYNDSERTIRDSSNNLSTRIPINGLDYFTAISSYDFPGGTHSGGAGYMTKLRIMKYSDPSPTYALQGEQPVLLDAANLTWNASTPTQGINTTGYGIILNISFDSGETFDSTQNVIIIDGINKTCIVSADELSCEYALTFDDHVYNHTYNISAVGFNNNRNFTVNVTRTFNYYGCGRINASGELWFNLTINNNHCFKINESNINFTGQNYNITGNGSVNTYGFIFHNNTANSSLRNINIRNFFAGVYGNYSSNASINLMNAQNNTYGYYFNNSQDVNVSTNATNNTVAQFYITDNSRINFLGNNYIINLSNGSTIMNITETATANAIFGTTYNLIFTRDMNFSFSNATNISFVRTNAVIGAEGVDAACNQIQPEWSCTIMSNLLIIRGGSSIAQLYIPYNQSQASGFNESRINVSRYSSGWLAIPTLTRDTTLNYVISDVIGTFSPFAAVHWSFQQTGGGGGGEEPPSEPPPAEESPPIFGGGGGGALETIKEIIEKIAKGEIRVFGFFEDIDKWLKEKPLKIVNVFWIIAFLIIMEFYRRFSKAPIEFFDITAVTLILFLFAIYYPFILGVG